MGNIIKIIDINNRDIVKYKYNSWGVVTRTICVTSSDASYLLAQYNPFVFKSYYYDPETRLYYLNSRFYSPELCRFITIDDHSYLEYESLGSISLYCYCDNNPINMFDSNGHLWNVLIGAGLATLADFTYQLLIEKKKLSEIDVSSVIISGIAGAASSLIPGGKFISEVAKNVVSSSV